MRVGGNPVALLNVADRVAQGPVLLRGQRRAQLIQRAQYEALARNPAVEPVQLGGLTPHLALQPARRRWQVPGQLRPQGSRSAVSSTSSARTSVAVVVMFSPPLASGEHNQGGSRSRNVREG